MEAFKTWGDSAPSSDAPFSRKRVRTVWYATIPFSLNQSMIPEVKGNLKNRVQQFPTWWLKGNTVKSTNSWELVHRTSCRHTCEHTIFQLLVFLSLHRQNPSQQLLWKGAFFTSYKISNVIDLSKKKDDLQHHLWKFSNPSFSKCLQHSLYFSWQ